MKIIINFNRCEIYYLLDDYEYKKYQRLKYEKYDRFFSDVLDWIDWKNDILKRKIRKTNCEYKRVIRNSFPPGVRFYLVL